MEKRGQVSLEYLVLTGFILAVVAVLFSYSYISNSETIKVNQANTALDKLVNKADLVYALGPDNNHFVFVTFPIGIESIQDVTVCSNGYQQHYGEGVASCSGAGQAPVTAGGIEMGVSLIGGHATISRPSKAEIEMDGFAGEGIVASGTSIRVKVFWCGEKICLKRA